MIQGASVPIPECLMTLESAVQSLVMSTVQNAEILSQKLTPAITIFHTDGGAIKASSSF